MNILKKHLFVGFCAVLALLMGTSLAWANSNSAVTREAAYEIVLQQGLNGNAEGKIVLGTSNPVPPNTGIKTWKGTVMLPNAEGWFFFIDDHPFANWEHPCRFVFVNIETGEYTEIPYRAPPLDMEGMEELAGMEVPQGRPAEQLTVPPANGHWYAVNAKAYAVIISGGANPYNNWVRYWNDSSYIYKTLVNYYGLKQKNIYVLMSDGTDPGADRHHYDGSYDSSPLDLDGDGDADIQYSATKANISTVFNELATKMDRDSYLFIFTTDHGGQESGWDCYLNLWGETIRDDEFAVEVNKITNHAGMIITMEQCHSGGMADDLVVGIGPQDPPRIIATACAYDESSWAMGPDYTYDEFVYYWTAAVNWALPDGTYVDADTDNDFMVQGDEAFNYAQSHDTASETPQYYDTGSFGDDLSLYFMTRRCVFQSASDVFKFKVVGKNGTSYGAYVKDDGIAGDTWQVKAIRKRPTPKVKDTQQCDGSLDNWSPAAAFSYSANKLVVKNVVKYVSGLDDFPARMNVRFKHYSSTHSTNPTKVIQKAP
jgi:hypothetical protein